MRSSAGAPIGVVTELMDMHAPLGGCIVALDVVGNGGGRGLGGLLELNGALDVGVTTEYGYCSEERSLVSLFPAFATCVPVTEA